MMIISLVLYPLFFVSPGSCEASGFRAGTDFNGGDLASMGGGPVGGTNSVGDCCHACRETEGCMVRYFIHAEMKCMCRYT
jgi:hypothetical protein